MRFSGKILRQVRVFEKNILKRQALERPFSSAQAAERLSLKINSELSRIQLADQELGGFSEINAAESLVASGKFAAGAEEIKRALEITKYAPADQGLFLSSVALLRLAKAYQLGAEFSREAKTCLDLVDLLSSSTKDSPKLLADPSVAFLMTRSACSAAFANHTSDGSTDGFAQCGVLANELRRNHAELALECMIVKCIGLHLSGLAMADEILEVKKEAATIADADHPLISILHLLSGMGELSENSQTQTTNVAFDAAINGWKSKDASSRLIFLGSYGEIPLDVVGLRKKGDESTLSQALSSVESKMGEDHPEVGECLRSIANMHYHRGEITSSEGLFRSAVGKLSSPPLRYPASAYSAELLTDTVLDFAYLLFRLEWNGKTRDSDAKQVLQILVDIQKNLPNFLPSSRSLPFSDLELYKRWISSIKAADPEELKSQVGGPSNLPRTEHWMRQQLGI